MKLTEETRRAHAKAQRERFRAATLPAVEHKDPACQLTFAPGPDEVCLCGEATEGHTRECHDTRPTLLERVKCSCGHPRGWHRDWVGCSNCDCGEFKGATHAR